jgi:hypothetical protein
MQAGARRLHEGETAAVDGDAVTDSNIDRDPVCRNDEFPRLGAEPERYDLACFLNDTSEHDLSG